MHQISYLLFDFFLPRRTVKVNTFRLYFLTTAALFCWILGLYKQANQAKMEHATCFTCELKLEQLNTAVQLSPVRASACYFKEEFHHEFLHSLFIPLCISWCSAAQRQQTTCSCVQPRFIALYFTVHAVFSEGDSDVSRRPIFLIRTAHSSICFPLSLTFMNSVTMGPCEMWFTFISIYIYRIYFVKLCLQIYHSCF